MKYGSPLILQQHRDTKMVSEHTPSRRIITQKSEVARHPGDATHFMESLLYLSFLIYELLSGNSKPTRSPKFPRAQFHSFSQDDVPPCETGPLGMTNVHQPNHPPLAALQDPAGASARPDQNLGPDSYSRAQRLLVVRSAVSAARDGKSFSITLLRDWKARELQTVGSMGCSVSQAKFKPWSLQNIV